MENFGKKQKPKEFSETRKIMLSFICMLSALSVLSVYTYGIRALEIILISVVTAVACKKICEEISKSDYPHSDLSGLATGLMTALLFPVSVPLYIPFFTAVFAVVVCMLPFGTAKNSPFVPAAAAFCFAALCFGDKVFAYSQPTGGFFKGDTPSLSLTSLLQSGTSVKLNSAVFLEILTGQMPSAIGTGFVIMLLGALLYILIRYPKNAVPAVAFLVSASLFSVVFPRVKTGALTSLTMEMCGGAVLFSAVFFMTYPSVIPSRLFSSAVWGLVSGAVCMSFRYFGKTEDSLIFGILIMNAVAGLFEELPLTKYEKKKIDDSTPYEETEKPSGVVPEEVLSEIPDISDEEIIAQSEASAENTEDMEQADAAENLHTAFSAENELTQGTAPFDLGGDGVEQ